MMAAHGYEEDDEHQEATSFISTEQVTIVGDSIAPAANEHQNESNVHDGSASFIMEYSNNQDLHGSHLTDLVAVSGRVSAIGGQNLQGAE